MKVLSLFSGVGGFDLGLEAAGMETVALCEWDRHAQSILRRHWPNTPLYGDVSELTGAQLIADGVYPDLVAFGSPCQDLSVAGKRAGLAGERSGLFHEATRIIRELRTLTDGTLPRWVVWENVVGALNSNAGADFGAVLDEMGNLGAHLIEWAVLDAQNYGVPQRRRRVFLVACLDPRTSARCPDPLLPVGQGSPRDLAPLREAWKASPAGSRRSPHGASGIIARAEGFGGYTVDDRTGTLKTRGNHADIDYIIDATRVGDIRIYPEPVQTLKARMGTGGNTVPLIGSWWDGGDQADTITTTSDAQRMPDKQRLQAVVVADTAATLLARNHKGPNERVDGQVVAYGFDEYNGTTDDIHNTLRAGTKQSTGALVFEPGAMSRLGGHNSEEVAPTLRADMGDNRPTVLASAIVRRLTPRECERLMGWPDDWTRWTDTGKEQADSHRYKQIGNGVASPVAEWVGRQIFAAEHFGR